MAINLLQMPRIAASTPSQLELMGSFMLANAEFARRKVKTNKDAATSNRLWKQLTESLNNIGPPVKSTDQWRKSWNDYKQKLKKQLRNGSAEGVDHESLNGIPAQVAEMLSLKTRIENGAAKNIRHTDNPAEDIKPFDEEADEFEAGESNHFQHVRVGSFDILQQESHRTAAYRKRKLEILGKYYAEKLKMKKAYYEKKLQILNEENQNAASQDIFANM